MGQVSGVSGEVFEQANSITAVSHNQQPESSNESRALQAIIDRQKITIEEQKTTIQEEKAVLDVQKNALDAQKIALDEQKTVIEEQKAVIEEQKNAIAGLKATSDKQERHIFRCEFLLGAYQIKLPYRP